MADPASAGAIIKVVGPLVLQGIGMAGGAIGASQEAGQNAEEQARQGEALRQHNARLQAGQAPPPAYSQSVGGYGQPGADGQYGYLEAPTVSFDNDPALQAPGYGSTEGRQQAMIQEFAQQIPPELLQPASQMQQAFMNQPPPRGPNPQAQPQGNTAFAQSLGLGPVPLPDSGLSVFGIPVAGPVWFDEGATQGAVNSLMGPRQAARR